jgi:hypothetical protein
MERAELHKMMRDEMVEKLKEATDGIVIFRDKDGMERIGVFSIEEDYGYTEHMILMLLRKILAGRLP